MTAILHKLSPDEVRERIDAGRAVLVDIREADEFARSHVRGAQSQPLSTWEKAHLNIDPRADVIFTCRSGMRTAGACDRLATRVNGDAFVLDGGLDAWAKAGLPIETHADAPMEIMRQVQIAAGSLVLLLPAAADAVGRSSWAASQRVSMQNEALLERPSTVLLRTRTFGP